MKAQLLLRRRVADAYGGVYSLIRDLGPGLNTVRLRPIRGLTRAVVSLPFIGGWPRNFDINQALSAQSEQYWVRSPV